MEPNAENSSAEPSPGNTAGNAAHGDPLLEMLAGLPQQSPGAYGRGSFTRTLAALMHARSQAQNIALLLDDVRKGAIEIVSPIGVISAAGMLAAATTILAHSVGPRATRTEGAP